MAKLIYSALTSLDGYVADESGGFDWAVPDEAVHGFINEMERPIGTHLYGRRMYEVMAAWESPAMSEGQPFEREFAEIWRAADKVVYSTTLKDVSSERTRIERTFDVEAVRQLKVSAPRDISIGGPGLAAQALAGGLVDECHFFLAPIVVGGGTPALPDKLLVKLELVGERSFDNGMVHVHYRVTSEF